MSRTMYSRLGAGMFAVGLLAACGSDEDSGGVQVDGAWARTSPMNAEAGVAYMVLSADDAVSIVSASADGEVAGRIELHETVPVSEDDMADDAMSDDQMADDEMADDEMADSEGDGGDMAMTMQQVTSIDIPAGGEVALEPGGLHVMLLELPDPLELGETFDLTLMTDAGDAIVVNVEVRDEAP